MTAAGVQPNDSAAYLPPPPSTSTPDAKATSAAGKPATDAPAADAPDAPSNFQSELEAQHSGTQQPSKQQTAKGAAESAGPAKTDAAKRGSGKPGKKRDARTDDANSSAVTPVPVAEPQKPILPFSLALQQPQEIAQLGDNATAGDKATPGETASLDPTSAAGTESGNTPVLPLAPLPFVTSNRLPVSPADLALPAIPQEPVASAVQDDRAASSPSALAFAARMVQQKSDQTGTVNPTQSPAVSGSQAAVQIPVRYAATAQIIQSAALGTRPGTQQDGSKKDLGASADTPGRPDARTDMVLPQFETVSQPAGTSGSSAPQQAAPPAPAESVMEPPAAPPTSSHDIRVRVPDYNGGSTQVRFVESGGEVRVSVHTADESLAQNLRTHLNDLTQRLSDGGMPAEIFKPAANAGSSQNDSQRQFQQDGRGSGGQGSGGQNGQQNRQQQRPAWLDEMEASLNGEQN